MMFLLELKENLKAFYARFSVPVDAAFRFAVSLAALLRLKYDLGFDTRLCGLPVLAALSLLCAFLPFGAVSVILGGVMLAHIYAVSFEIALLAGVFLIMVALLYYGLQQGDSVWLILTPLAFMLKIPYVIPLLAGLSGALSGVFPVSFGIVIYYLILYVKQNAGVLTNDASVDITQKYSQIIRSFAGNRVILVYLAACALGLLAVWLIRNLSVDHAWGLALSAGTVVQLAAVFAGDVLFDISMPVPELLVGILVSLAIALVYHFFVFAVDYTRTEHMQFEDDDYVYYVKAVPKIAVAKPDVKVQRINNPRR